MNVLLISQCDKRALGETRRILDQFAERRGDRTWQTPITQEGLDTLHRLLRKTARKNTAVACHRVRGTDHTELVWVVGDRRRFNSLGTVPTNTTRRDVLRQADENDWHTGELIRLLVDLAGLLHDLGKAIDAFQARLAQSMTGRNLIRHEWVSLRLLEAFVGADDDATWLARLARPEPVDDARWLSDLRRDGLDGPLPSPFLSMARAPLAQALGWLVLTHHRLPVPPDLKSFSMSRLSGLLHEVQADWNERRPADESSDAAQPLQPYWQFSEGLPVTTPAWRERASRMAKRLAAVASSNGKGFALQVLDNPFVMHLGRLCLMLADHHYSSLEGAHPERLQIQAASSLIANTCRQGGQPNQSLDEHLLGVARLGAEVAQFLPGFAQHLPGLVAHRRLRQRSRDDRYRWQDKAADLAAGLRERTVEQGGFIVNMASTGCGKTLGNARIMYHLADPVRGMRCAFAMGLRTLTLQTGRSFQQMLNLNEDEVAIRVGGTANRLLFEHHEQMAEKTGSASRQGLLDEDAHVVYEGDVDGHPLLRRALGDEQVRRLLVAPLLVCTIDHLIPATESQRGGHQIAPMLRLMSGDLVLDEPDDFDLDDLPALTRLVHWAGLLGARVLLSSATLPPSLVQGLFEAYRDGRHHHQRNCGARPGAATDAAAVCCVWVDEFSQRAEDCVDATSFESAHTAFALARRDQLEAQVAMPKRRAALLPFGDLHTQSRRDWASLAAGLAPQLMLAARGLHRNHHAVDAASGKRVSFGLLRMANIEPLVEVALSLFKQDVPVGTRVHLCVYHSRHPLLVRSLIEQQLDRVLQRHDPMAVFSDAGIRSRLDSSDESDQIFIVLGSPVTEVGRDHDYDWALVEPSSMRSLIQLAGRVRRHRSGTVATPNILVLDRNLRDLRHPGRAAYCRPGFERDDGPFRLLTHDLGVLLRAEELSAVDARPRIVAPSSDALRSRDRLSDLEHARIRQMMLPSTPSEAIPAIPPRRALGSRQRAHVASLAAGAATGGVVSLNASTWWHRSPRDSQLSGVLQRMQPFRDSADHEVDLVLLPDEDASRAVLHRVMGKERRQPSIHVRCDQECVHLSDLAVRGVRIEPWGVTDYLQALTELADDLELSLAYCAERFGQVTVPESASGWRYHPALGFSRRPV